MSPRDHLIVCGPDTPIPPAWAKWKGERHRLDTTPGLGRVRLQIGDITKRMVAPLPAVAEDLVEVATYVYAADQATERGGLVRLDYGKEWRRRFRFVVPVRRPDVWQQPTVKDELVRTLSFLSDDDYEFEFVASAAPVPWPEYLGYGGDPGEPVAGVQEVLLFSGGLDSLAGAVEEVLVRRRKVALVSHRHVSKLDSRQKELARALGRRAGAALSPFHVPILANKEEALGVDNTQRTRSFLFAAFAAVVARMFDLDRVRFYENGVVSCNLPICAQVLGGRASRTTHPRVLAGYERLLGAVFERPFVVENPFFWNTRTEILQRLRASGHADLTASTVSCAHTHAASAERPHCGKCSQCVDRRLAVLAAGLSDAEDPPDRYRTDLLTGHLDDVLDQTMVERIVGTAREVGAIQGPLPFFQRYGEAARLLRYVPGQPDRAAVDLFDLHRRHAGQVNGALRTELANWLTGGRWHELRPTCLLRMLAAPAAAPKPVGGVTRPPEFVATAAHLSILQVLAASNRTMIQVDIEAGSGVSRSTIWKRLRELLRANLIHYPHGARKGAAITEDGRRVLATAYPPKASA